MKCMNCGSEMVVTHEDRPYAELPDVILAGVEVARCAKCDDEEVSIPRMDELHRVLTARLVAAPWRLRGAEIRFLRKFMGWSGADFARRFGVEKETVSRWENDQQVMGTTAERFLRYVVATSPEAPDYTPDAVFETMPADRDEMPTPTRLDASGPWTAAA